MQCQGQLFSFDSVKCKQCNKYDLCKKNLIRNSEVAGFKQLLEKHEELFEPQIETCNEVVFSIYAKKIEEIEPNNPDYMDGLDEDSLETLSRLPQSIRKSMAKLLKIGMGDLANWNDEKRVSYCPKNIQIVFNAMKNGCETHEHLVSALLEKNKRISERTVNEHLGEALNLLYELNVFTLEDNKIRLHNDIQIRS